MFAFLTAYVLYLDKISQQPEYQYFVMLEFAGRAAVYTVNRQFKPSEDEPKLVFSEVVLLDKGHNPLLYLLHKEAMQCHSGNMRMTSHTEPVLSEVVRVDPLAKKVYMANGTVVRYRYLIAFKGDENDYNIEAHRDQQLESGVNALLGALRVQSGWASLAPANTIVKPHPNCIRTSANATQRLQLAIPGNLPAVATAGTSPLALPRCLYVLQV